LKNYFFFILLLLPYILFAQKLPKPAPVIPSEKTLHDEVLVDNYAWMRDKHSKQMLRYLKAENAYANGVMKNTGKLQKVLYNEMLARIPESDISVPFLRRGYLYYSKSEKTKDHSQFYRKKSPDGGEELLLDVNQVVKQEKCYFAFPMMVSPNNHILPYMIDKLGNGNFNLHFKELNSSKVLPDVLFSVSSFAWAADNKSVFYTVKDSVTNRSNKLYRHVLGTPVTDAVLLFEEKDPTFNIYVNLSRSDKFIFLISYSSNESEIRVISAENPEEEMALVHPREEGHIYTLSHSGDHFYIHSNKNAVNFKLLKAPVSAPFVENWQEVIPHEPQVFINNISGFQNFILLSTMNEGFEELWLFEPRSGEKKEINLDKGKHSIYPQDNWDYDPQKIRFTATSLITPYAVYEKDISSGEIVLLKQKEIPSGFSPDDYVFEQLWTQAADGIEIPVSVVYRKGLKKDGKNPLLIEGYGAYGASGWHYFNSNIFSIIDRGFVYAIAHVRGGDEMGRPWYIDGKMKNKKNSFNDFISVTEHLIDEKYTSRGKIVAYGASAGGLLMGAVVNARPDLYRGVILQVPFVDVLNTMLDTTLPLTTEEFKEWGSPYEKEYFDYIRSYCPYSNVSEKEYPDLLFVSGFYDEQVGIWEPAKMIAKLRAKKTCDNLILFRVNFKGGHGGDSGRRKRLQERAFEYAFMLKILDKL
jgi:oligopeptidase B